LRGVSNWLFIANLIDIHQVCFIEVMIRKVADILLGKEFSISLTKEIDCGIPIRGQGGHKNCYLLMISALNFGKIHKKAL